MSVAEDTAATPGAALSAPPRRALRGWLAVLAALFAGALILRVVGLRSGLPYIYNSDENSHFVPHAVGMFGHTLNPLYFVNPPAFTYVVHLLLLVRYGSDPASVGGAYATDPTGIYTLARAAAAVLGALAVPLTAVAGARLFADRRVGALAGALLAVAFLPVFYSHFALNDAPTMAPSAAALVGVAGIYRSGRLREYLLAGLMVGLAIATKYTAGILVLSILAASLASPVAHARVRNLALAAALLVAGFFVANPYALFDSSLFRSDLRKQTDTAGGDEGSKLGLAAISGWRYYLGTSTWGLGWLPSLAALGGAVGLVVKERRIALVLLPAPLVLFAYLGHQSRFFARWMLPLYPVACIVAAWAVVAAVTWLAARAGRARAGRWALAAAAVVVCLQGLVFSLHGDVVLARADTRQTARDWLVQHVPAGTKMVVEPVFPDQWAADVGHPDFAATNSGDRWTKWLTSRSQLSNTGKRIHGAARVVKLEDYERTLRPALVDAYRRGGFCWVVTGSTQYGRAYAAPKQVPHAIAYYAELRKQATVAYRISPYGDKPVPFSFDDSFDYYPLQYARPGPEIVVYRLRNCSP